MTQITIRGLNPDIDEEIREKARKSGKSLNRVILDMIEKGKDSETKKLPEADSLKELAGGWKNEDAAAFYESIKICDQIDEDMWK